MLSELTTGLGKNPRHQTYRDWNSAPRDDTDSERYFNSHVLLVPPAPPHTLSNHLSTTSHQRSSQPEPTTQQRTSSNYGPRQHNQEQAKTNSIKTKKPDRTEANLQNPYIT